MDIPVEPEVDALGTIADPDIVNFEYPAGFLPPGVPLATFEDKNELSLTGQTPGHNDWGGLSTSNVLECFLGLLRGNFQFSRTGAC